MGQKSSKRQSYTPGVTQDAGLPSVSAAENGDIRSGGANGQVQLISSRESQYGDVISADVMTSSPVDATASSPPVATEKEKKKRKAPRFVFTLRRTGSGKRPRKNRKETNGVRPTSYPAALPSEETAEPRAATDRHRKAQSMFVEVVSEGVVEEVNASASHDDGTEAGKEHRKSTPPKKTSSDSTASPSKAHRDKKRNGSQKQKSPSKKKEKDSKKKSKKKDKTDEAKTGEGEDRTAVASSSAAEGPLNYVPAVDKPPLELSLQATSTDSGNGTGSAEEVTAVETKTQVTQEQPTEAAMELAVAAVTESDVKLSFPDNTAEQPLIDPQEPDITADQLLAEIDETILRKEERESSLEKETQDDVQLKSETYLTAPEQKAEASAEEQLATQTTPAEKVELAGHTIHEDILELINIPGSSSDSTQENSGPKEESAADEAADRKTDAVGDTSGDAKEVVESVMIVEVQSSLETVRQEEPVSETVLQQVEQLVECTPDAKTSVAVAQEGAEQEIGPSGKQSSVIAEQAEGPPKPSSSEEPVAADTASKPAEGAPSPLTPAELKALEKELKAAKKKEEKERARKEKEEKKRLKEEKKREAREQKRREKEDREQRLRESRAQARASASMTVEVRPEEAVQPAAEEAFTASQTVAVQSMPGASASTDIQPREDGKEAAVAEKTVVVEHVPSTCAECTGVEGTIQMNVETDVTNLPAPSTTPSSPPPTTTHENEADDRKLGSSVKEIVTSIESTVSVETKTYDEHTPPEVPDAPYPDEEEEEEKMQQTSAVSQFSAAPVSPEAQHGSEDTGESSSPKSVFPPEVSESARSSVLRKIELGPRLRTAILRKSSSGAESDEKRVSLTQPRHVQVSDLTPPPRKPRARRPLEHTRDSTGNYCYSSPSTSPLKAPEPVVEEQLSVEAASSENAASSVNLSEQKTEGTEVESEGTEITERVTVITVSLSQSAQLPSHSPQKADSPEEEKPSVQEKEDSIQLNAQLMKNLISSQPAQSILSEPESSSPAFVAVGSIVLAGQTGPSDTVLSQSPDKASEQEEEGEGGTVKTEGQIEDQGRPDDVMLQKMAAEVVGQVQKAAQEKASTLETQEKIFQLISDSSAQAKDSGGDHDVVQAESPGANSKCDDHSDSDSDCEAGLVQPTVVCSAELVGSGCSTVSHTVDRQTKDSTHSETERSERQDTDTQGAGDQSQAVTENAAGVAETNTASREPNRHDEMAVTVETAASPSSAAEPSSDVQADSREQAAEDTVSPEDRTGIATDTAQLQQFNKNYYDISVVVDNYDEEVSKTASKAEDTAPADNQEQADSLVAQDPVRAETSQQPSAPSEENDCAQSSSQQPDASAESEQTLQSPDLSSGQLENGGADDGEVQQSVTEGKVTVTVRCNGSHVHNEDDSIDTLLRRINGNKEVVRDTVENNNNVSTEDKTAPEGGETIDTVSTSDSRG
ncbi:uncharacterized protein LOC143297577 isoform X2 [Babylonia areolata]|uniref:uncharacterized protein LOC143297577 isoform X2 n=1 Tax=Babylonia areolata TaxID=304850 RepID=UPI003FD1ECEA